MHHHVARIRGNHGKAFVIPWPVLFLVLLCVLPFGYHRKHHARIITIHIASVKNSKREASSALKPESIQKVPSYI